MMTIYIAITIIASIIIVIGLISMLILEIYLRYMLYKSKKNK